MIKPVVKKLGYILNIFILSLIFITSYSISNDSLDSSKPELSKVNQKKAIDKLRNDINNIISDKGLSKTKVAIAVYSVDEQKYYYQKNIDDPFTPASTTKVFTNFSALYTMGADYQIRTSVYTDGDIENGILKGNLYIYGRGDALLTIADIDALSSKISAKGIKQVEGNIYADASYFDDKKMRIEYSSDKDVVEALPPITALCIEKNLATIIVSAGSNANEGIKVTVLPKSESLSFINNVRFSGGKQKNDGKKQKSGSRRRIISIGNSISKDGKQKFIISGELSANQNYSYKYFISNPPLACAGALKSSLICRGISVKGGISEGKMESISKSRHLITECYRPITEQISVANKESDNFLAEMMFKMIGAYGGDHNENGKKARAIERMIFDGNRVNFSNCILNDGSGLSRRNLITARSLVSLFVKAQYLPFGDDFYATLPIAGVDGTLHKRMKHTLAESNLVAKTGTLRNVSALTGYVTTRDGELLAFAFVFNGPYVYDYKRTEDKLGVLLASFSYSLSE
jgi:serine-type D-Ala-D-Ala carboxypeptidase/endopeptidase (penicillin-binding protein 4)